MITGHFVSSSAFSSILQVSIGKEWLKVKNKPRQNSLIPFFPHSSPPFSFNNPEGAWAAPADKYCSAMIHE
jgi:hypothetical protein